jgi:hypothetical protein
VFQYLIIDLQNDSGVVYKERLRYLPLRTSIGMPMQTRAKRIVKTTRLGLDPSPVPRPPLMTGTRSCVEIHPPRLPRTGKLPIQQRHAMLFRQTIDNKRLPRHVKRLIFDFSSEAHCAKELLTCGPFIDLLKNRTTQTMTGFKY